MVNIDFFRSSKDNIYFCDKCKIIFQIGCTHSSYGCANNLYYSKLVYEVVKDNKIMKGMPTFESIEDLLLIIGQVKFKWVCMCEGMCARSQCILAYYKDETLIKRTCDIHFNNYKKLYFPVCKKINLENY